MEDIRQDSVLAFDICFCNNQIRMLKVLTPFLGPHIQKYLALYIKYQEIQYIMQCYSRPMLLQGTCFDAHGPQKSLEVSHIFDQLIPFCTPGEKERLLHIRNLLDTLQSIKGMMEMMESMKELFPEGMEGMGDLGSMFGMNGAADISSLFGLNGNSDMSSLFEMMNGFNNNQ